MNGNDAVKRMLEIKGISQAKLAHLLGFVRQQNISILLMGEVKVQFMARVAEALGFDFILRDKTTGETITVTYDPDFESKRSKK